MSSDISETVLPSLVFVGVVNLMADWGPVAKWAVPSARRSNLRQAHVLSIFTISYCLSPCNKAF